MIANMIFQIFQFYYPIVLSFTYRGNFVNGSGDPVLADLYYEINKANDTSIPSAAGEFITLPSWTNCSIEANSYRDYLKGKALPFLDAANTSSHLTFAYDKWNTNNEVEGSCSFGSGQNQMTMTYISFTGWLRLVKD